ncbi:hypothetical protein [Streptomyces sp. NPDC015130]|uniref:hypothetical protein n=1 Tax=Streptomyces sp. NPDC015130 TaxID=3364940 RepID=UPI0037018A17
MPKTTDTTTTPPPAAVARDPHWAAKLERLRARKPATQTLTICDDATVRQNLAQAKTEHDTAVAYGNEDSQKTTAQALEAAQAAFDEAAIVLTFQALPSPAFQALKEAHPPTEKQAEDDQAINLDTIGPELVSQSSLDGLTPEDAAHFLESWGTGEATQLFMTAWNVQNHVRSDLGKG